MKGRSIGLGAALAALWMSACSTAVPTDPTNNAPPTPGGTLIQDPCAGGTCTITCVAPDSLCGGACTSTADDPQNCGACGHACEAGQRCRGGACEATCPEGQVLCGDKCATLANDPRNCGACGQACGAGQVCGDGQCVTSCPANQTDCSGSCKDTAHDPSACGACTNTCPSGPQSKAYCASSVCGLECTSGRASCDGSAATGCETDTRGSRTNCGGCGLVCPLGGACFNGNCLAPPPSVHEAVKVFETCTNYGPTANRSVAVDAAGVIYVAALCDGAMKIAVSKTSGDTWTPPVAVPGFEQATFVTLVGGEAGGFLYVFGLDATGELFVSTSTDSGATFSASPTLITTGAQQQGISANLDEGNLFVEIVKTQITAFTTPVRNAAVEAWAPLTLFYNLYKGDAFAAWSTLTNGLDVSITPAGDYYENTSQTRTKNSGFGFNITTPLVHPTGVYVPMGWGAFSGDGNTLEMGANSGPKFTITMDEAVVVPSTRSLRLAGPADILVASEGPAGTSNLKRISWPDPTSEPTLGKIVSQPGARPQVAAIHGTSYAVVAVEKQSDVYVAVIQP